MRRVSTAFTVLCAVTVALAVWWNLRDGPEPGAPAIAAARGSSSADRAVVRPARIESVAGPAAPVDRPPAPSPPNYLARLRVSDDYWDFAQSIHAAAEQGDAAAQYALWSALSYCESLYDWYFIVHTPSGGVRHRTLDEAQQLTASRPVFTADDVRDIQKRCQRLRSAQRAPFGQSREWLDASLASNYPMAQASAALTQALQGRQPDSDGARAARDAARRLAFDSLRTRDPRVMAQLGDVAANLARDDPAEARKLQWIWPLAACLRETHCDSMTEWMRLYCHVDTQCQPFETPVDVIRRLAGNDFDEVERRARELNAKLDADTLEEGDIAGD